MRIPSLLLFLLLTFSARTQELFLAPVNPHVEALLDQLSTDHKIELNTVVKPFSRSFVAEKLTEAAKNDQLTLREKRKIHFYSTNYQLENKQDSVPLPLFSSHPVSARYRLTNKTSRQPWLRIGVVPVLDLQYSSNQVFKTEFGAAVYGYQGRHLGFSFQILKGFQSEALAGYSMFTQEKGQKYYAYSTGGAEYYEWTGQLMVSWKWGSFGVVKDRLEWGNNYHGSSIFSNKPPSFPFLQLRVKPAKWIEFRYIHGMMRSNVMDSSRSFQNGGNEIIYHPKYIVANLLTLTPWKNLNISFGSSSIYADKIQSVYFIPLLFYKSVDETLYQDYNGTSGANSQMFLDLSSRQIKHLHLYLTLFIDEFKMSRIRDPKENNFLGWKGGFKLWDLPIADLSITVEGTRTLPLVYQHNVPVTTFESDGYNLGNYLRDNSQEIYCALSYSPSVYFSATLSFLYAEHGDNFRYEDVANPTILPVLKNLTWIKQAIGAKIESAISSNILLFLAGEYSNTTGLPWFTPPSYRGKTTTLSAGLLIGL